MTLVALAVAVLCLIFLTTKKAPPKPQIEEGWPEMPKQQDRPVPDELPVAYKSDVLAWYEDAKKSNERFFMFCHDGKRRVDMCLTLGGIPRERVLQDAQRTPYLKIFKFFDTERSFEEQWQEYIGETVEI